MVEHSVTPACVRDENDRYAFDAGGCLQAFQVMRGDSAPVIFQARRLTRRYGAEQEGDWNWMRSCVRGRCNCQASGQFGDDKRMTCALLDTLSLMLYAPVATMARAADEIQVYDAAIADQGQWTLVNHSNYTFNSRRGPDFPGGLDPNHAFNSTPEFAYGVAPWFEFGFYIPWAIGRVGQPSEQQFVSNNFKLRTLFVTPEADKLAFWYGLNFEFDFPTKYFAQTRVATEVRPIIGWRTMESAQSA
jgi:hypothetical protein